MKMQTANMTLEELQLAQAKIAAEIEQRQGAEFEKFRDQCEAESIARFGRRLDGQPAAIASTQAASRSMVAPKYRDPDNHELTWTGRGKMPVWLRSHVEAGLELERFLIDRPADDTGPDNF